MSALQYLRQSKLIARWVLVWFALSVTAAVAAPVLNPQALTLVCSAAGQVKLVNATSGDDAASTVDAQGAAGAVADLHSHLDCVLCLSLNVPPLPATQLPLRLTLTGAKPVSLVELPAPPLRALTLSARGPPASAGFALPL
jgi:hypothetical protein